MDSSGVTVIAKDRLLAIVRAFACRRIVVIGDVIADEFIYGQIARVSREAPVLILDYGWTEIVPGGAGNAASNVAALGGRVSAIGVVGRDDSGRRLVATMRRRRIDVRRMLSPGGYRTPTKTRILAGGIHSAKQQLVRIDRASHAAAGDRARKLFEDRVLTAAESADALLVSDYGSGLVTPVLVASARDRMRVPIVLVDSRYELLRYKGMTACTPNESEAERALGVRIGDNPRALERAGRGLLARTRARAVLITRGSRGMA